MFSSLISRNQRHLPLPYLVLLLLLFTLTLPNLVSSQSSTTTSTTTTTLPPPQNTTTQPFDIITTTTPTSLPASGTRLATVSSIVLTLTINTTGSGIQHNTTSSTTFVPPGSTPTTIIIGSSNTSAYLFPNNTLQFPNGTSLYPNGTEISSNGTIISGSIIISNQPYNGSLEMGLPFRIVLDPGYGVAGGILMVSGGFVGVWGGKNRWSAMAIVTGYAFLLFTLVMILSFGVSPSFQPPTPHPPTTTTRGIYTLVCIISAIIGSAIGIFFWNFAKYFVCGVGGFTFGWWVVVIGSEGLEGNIIARWAIIGGLAVIIFCLGLIPRLHTHLVIIATSWIGATALTLGIDCFARTGLKESYIYNLGYYSLFPSLNGYRYPLLVVTQVMLGVIAAWFAIFASIQYRILSVLREKVQQIQVEDEELERREIEDATRSAERFKNLATDMEKWNSKYSSPLDHVDVIPKVTILEEDGSDGRTSSTYLLNSPGAVILGESHQEGNSPSSQGVHRPSADTRGGGQSVGILPVMDVGDPLSPTLGMNNSISTSKLGAVGVPEERMDEDYRKNMLLLEEIQELRRSIDEMRKSSSPSQRVPSRNGSPSGRQIEPSVNSSSPRDMIQGRATTSVTIPSSSSLTAKDIEWEAYLSSRQLFVPPAGITPPISSSSPPISPHANNRLSRISPAVLDAVSRRDRTMSAFELGSTTESDLRDYDNRAAGRTTNGPASRRYSNTYAMGRSTSGDDSRRINTYSPAPKLATHASMLDTKDQRDGNSRKSSHHHSSRRSVTMDELAARHKVKMSKLQQQLTEELTPQSELAEAKQYAQREANRLAMARKEEERKRRNSTRAIAGEDGYSRTKDRRASQRFTGPTENPIVKTPQWPESVSASVSADSSGRPRDKDSQPATRASQDSLKHTLNNSSKRVSRGPDYVIN